MPITCPNRRLGAWRNLVKAQGEQRSYVLWNEFEGVVPQEYYEVNKAQNVFNQKSKLDNQIQYRLKAVDILLSDRAQQVFNKGEKNKWSLDKILTELAIPKQQKQILLDLGITDREQLALELASKYGYSVEVNTAKQLVTTNRLKDVQGEASKYYSNKTGRYYRYTEELGWISSDVDNRNQEVDVELPDDAEVVEYNTYSVNEEVSIPTQHYSNLTVPGGTNYTENEISTPLITPSIKGHAQFSTDNGIGWFRSDEKGEAVIAPNIPTDKELLEDYNKGYDGKPYPFSFEKHKEMVLSNLNSNTQYKPSKTRRILELQSDLFQKGRDKKDLHDRIETVDYKGKQYHIVAEGNTSYFLSSVEPTGIAHTTPEDIDFDDEGRPYQSGGEDIPSFEEIEVPKSEIKSTNEQKNQFLQLLNKDNNWVTFFIKSIIQDTAKQTITEVQESDVEAKVRQLEKEGLLEIDCSKVKAKDGIRGKFTKGSQWEIVKDLKGYPSHAQGGVDIKIGKNGFSFTRDNGVIEAKYGLVLTKIR